MTDQEKMERRRQKRQQRILQSGESRLSKITGTAFPNRATPSPTPSPSTSINKPSDRTLQRRDSDDPSEELGAPQPFVDQQELMNQTFASMFGGVSDIPGSESGGAFNSATLLGEQDNMNNEAIQNLLAGAGGGGEGVFNPAAIMAIVAGANADQQNVIDNSAKYWNLLHLVMMAMLGIYAVYIEWTRAGSERFATLLFSNIAAANYPSIHVPLFWYFVTLELCMQSARMFYQQGTMPPTSTMAKIARHLPHPFGNIVTIFLRYRLILTCLVQDICVLVFMIGISQLVSNVLL